MPHKVVVNFLVDFFFVPTNAPKKLRKFQGRTLSKNCPKIRHHKFVPSNG